MCLVRDRLPAHRLDLAQLGRGGEHTEDILMDVLDLDWDDITKLREQEIIL